MRDEDRIWSARFAFAAFAAGKKNRRQNPARYADYCVCDFMIVYFFSIRGWFYKDRFIGSEPNEKLKKKLKKKSNVTEEDAPPLPPPPSLIL